MTKASRLRAAREAAARARVEAKAKPAEATRKRPCMLCDGDCFYTADIVSKYREAYQTERIAPEVYVKDIDLETPPATLPANPALFARR